MSDRFAPDFEELLRFYADAGYDEALDDMPHDRFAQAAAAKAAQQAAASAQREMSRATESRGTQSPRQAPRQSPGQSPGQTPAPRHSSATIPDEAQVARAREIAQAAPDLASLRAALEAFDGCNLRNTAKQLVFGEGNPQASIMLIGDPPSREDDLDGQAFSGRDGLLLDRILAAMGLDRTSSFLATMLPWRPPGNRDPSPIEMEICRPFIERQVELVAPRILVLLGNPASRMMLRASENIMRIRGNWQDYSSEAGLTIPAMPTFAPRYLLDRPAHKALAWRDMLEVKARLKDLTSGG